MNAIYYYEHDCTDFTTTGACGDLMPVECLFTEEKNGISQLTMRLAYDPYGKWKYPKVGGYIKAPVPVRVPPQIVDGDYATKVARYESINTSVPVYMRQDENSPVVAMVRVGQNLYGKNIIPILDNFVQVAVKPFNTDDPSEKRIIGYYPKTNVRKVEEINVVPASYGMESITDLVTRLADQYFQIVEIVQGDEYVDVTAEHVFYELLNNYTSYKPDALTEISGSTCVNQILANAFSNDGRFEISSSSAKTLKGVDFSNKNVVEALLDPEKGACALYNMVLLRDNYSIYCLPEEDVGYDRGFVVEYGKNLASVKRTENIEETITRIFPYGKKANGDIYYIANGQRYVDSEYIDDYGSPRVMLLDTGLVIGKDGVTAQNIDQKLRDAAQAEYDDNKVDLPRLTMEISFVSLGDTEEYKQFRGLDKVYLYDKITVKDTFRDYAYLAEVVGVTHNVLTGTLESVTLGSLDNSDGERKIAVWQVPTVDGTNIRLKSIGLGVLAPSTVGTDELIDKAVTSAKIANLAIGTAQIDDASITNAKIGTAGIDYAKIKDLEAGTAIITDAIVEEGISDKLFISRLSVSYGQMVSATIGDLVIGASNGKYYHLDVSWNGSGTPSLVPTEVQVSQAEIASGHTATGHSIVGVDATFQDLSTTNFYAINSLVDKITAKRIDVNELWARQAFINKLNVQDLTSNTYIHAAITGLQGDISDVQQTADGVNVEVGKIKDGTTAVKALDNTRVAITANGVSIKTGGTFSVASGNFSLDSSGNVTVKGNVQASSGSIGGWAIGTNDLHSGSGASYVALSTTGDYAMWAGNASAAAAPFRVKRDGTVYSSKFVIVNEQGGESTIDLRNYALWKLNYKTIKSVDASTGVVTLSDNSTFNSAASVVVGAGWGSGASSNKYTVTKNGSEVASTTVSATHGSWANGSMPIYAYANGANRASSSVPAPSITSLSAITLLATDISKTHDCTVTYAGTSDTKKVQVNAGAVYNAGVAAGEAEFTEHNSTVYTVSESGYAGINLGYWQGSTSPPSGFHSVGTGFYKIATAASTWYTKN